MLYVPTHSDLSSLDYLTPELAGLADQYNVIVKVHYATARVEKERMKNLEETKVIITDDTTDILPLFKKADIVLSDNSSTIFEAILADKPVVIADFWAEAYLDHGHKEMRAYAGGVQGALTYQGSIEQVIKREHKVKLLKNPKELLLILTEALAEDVLFSQEREKLRMELFSFRAAGAGARAAAAIKSCLAETAPNPKPIMYHAFAAFCHDQRETERGGNYYNVSLN